MSIRAGLALVLALGPGCEREPPHAARVDVFDSPREIAERIIGPGEGGAVHFVRLVQRADRYAFEPSELTIPPGDVVRFVMVGGKPESIAFAPDESSPRAAADFIREHSLHLGVLLTEAGQAYDVAFRDAPAGRYAFRSLPRDSEGMHGVVIVGDPGDS